MKSPKEDPKDKEARLRERRMAEIERSDTVRTEARGLTGDIRRTFGNQVSIFGVSRPVGAMPGRTPTTNARNLGATTGHKFFGSHK